MAINGFGMEEQNDTRDKSKKKSRLESKKIATAAGLLSTKDDKRSCIFCNQAHDTVLCAKTKKMTQAKNC